jgi:hypothetical protein
MALRIEVLEDCQIEVMRPRGNREPKRFYYKDQRRALLQIEFFLRRDVEKARRERFVPQLQKEARKLFSQLQEKNPYGQKS